MSKKLFIVVNEDRFFLSHRKDIAIKAMQEGYDVTIVCKDTGQHCDVKSLGLRVTNLPINPTGENIVEEFKTFWFLCKLYRKERPDVVHHVGLKNILWGGLAAYICKIKGVVNAVSGLGTLFNGNTPSITARITMMIMQISNNRKNVIVIFQNHEDESLFYRYNVVKKEQVTFIKGSGVDLAEFNFTPIPLNNEKIHVIFTGRMVREKGVLFLTEAAEMMRKTYEDKVDFWLCGRLSSTPNALTEEELRSHCDDNYIKWLGHRSDIIELLRKSTIVAFPSFYREGVPKSLIEAAAIGRPIITCDSIGCKDTVDDGINGFLIPIKDSKALAEKLSFLIERPELCIEMGKASRRKAEKEFALEHVVNTHINVYNSLSGR
ncbi:MAG: glycosyltransferase family 4 protein [Bacteroidaceae bacterium]|nr:glycosyltransferase family 4 protein [Bacteroidaceae bacterium]